MLTALEDWRSEIEDNRLRLSSSSVGLSGPRRIPTQLQDLIEGIGLPVLGVGSCRLVFELERRLVLKVGFTAMGMAANRRELSAYNAVGDVFCAKVLAVEPAGLWLVQERVEVPQRLKRATWMRVLNQVQRRYGYVCFDAHSQNFGRRPNGDLVLVDLEHVSNVPPSEWHDLPARFATRRRREEVAW